MRPIEHNTVVRLRTGGLQMTVKTQDPGAARFGANFVLCESVVKGKLERGYFRFDQLIVLLRCEDPVAGKFEGANRTESVSGGIASNAEHCQNDNSNQGRSD
jgi:hypothetical protein